MNLQKRCHVIDYEILGDDIQVVEITLDPRETVIAEAGAMNYMDTGISFETKLGDGSNPSAGFLDNLWSAGKRVLAGDSLFMTHFTNNAPTRKTIAFSGEVLGKIVPLDMQALGGRIIVQKDAFLAASLGTKIDLFFNKRLGSGFFGGEGFILQKIDGDDKVFLSVGGTVITKHLQGEKLLVDPSCIVGFTEGINFDIQFAGDLKSSLLGGEGLFLATLQGRGTVMLQSMPFERLARRIVATSGVGSVSNSGSNNSVVGDLIRNFT
jgi:uncharacterized protein (TIGR00266 family)